MFKNFPWFAVKEFLCRITFAFILFVLSLVVLVSSSYAQESPLPTCSTTQWTTCIAPSNNPQNLNNQCLSNYPGGFFSTGSGCSAINGNPNDIKLTCQSNCSCPSGYIMNTTINGGNYHSECIEDTGGEQPDPVDIPQECGITGFPIWNGSGYDCVEDFDTPCPEGTTNGMYTLPGYDPRPYCADATPPNSSSAGSASSNSGQNSSSNNSDGNGDGSGSSSGNNDNSYSASSTCNGVNSSGSASSGKGGSASSAGAGECDPTSKNYLECLNSKEINLPTEKGTFDGTGTDAEDRIGELEGELTDLVNQIKGEIQDVTGASVGGSGTLTDKCYQILKVEVCFGWARWSSLLSVIGTAIIAAAGVASFIIIMRQ